VVDDKFLEAVIYNIHAGLSPNSETALPFVFVPHFDLRLHKFGH